MSMTPRAGLMVADELAAFIEGEALPGTGIKADVFWTGTAAIFERFAPRNRRLLARRDELQARIDEWHAERRGQPYDVAASEAFLRDSATAAPNPGPSPSARGTWTPRSRRWRDRSWSCHP